MTIRILPTLFLLSFLLFQGCSPLKPYPAQEINNIIVSTKVESGSFFSSIQAEIDIYTIMTGCKEIYEGTLSLDTDSISTGIKLNKESRLSFIFKNESFLGNSSSSTHYSVYLKPRKGYRYDFVATYKDNIYNVELYEINIQTKQRRALETGTKKVCLVDKIKS